MSVAQSSAVAIDELRLKPECFVIMPFSEGGEYEPGHFLHVFDDIIAPACSEAGYNAVRADQIRETNLIHLDVLQRLIVSPLVLCDLSARNPNVLFELGLRQAFDKPVVLIQEKGTPKIFDIAPLRYTEYRSSLVYHEVIEDRQKIAAAIRATAAAFASGDGVNSMVRILSITQPATLNEVQEASQDPALQILRAELNDLRAEMRDSFRGLAHGSQGGRELGITEANRISYELDLMERVLASMLRNGSFESDFKERLRHARTMLEDGLAVYQYSELWSKIILRLARMEAQYEELMHRSQRTPNQTSPADG